MTKEQTQQNTRFSLDVHSMAGGNSPVISAVASITPQIIERAKVFVPWLISNGATEVTQPDYNCSWYDWLESIDEAAARPEVMVSTPEAVYDVEGIRWQCAPDEDSYVCTAPITWDELGLSFGRAQAKHMNANRPSDTKSVDGEESQMDYHYKVEEVEAVDALIECGSACGWTGHQSQGASVESCALTPGDPSPACRCPCCDSLAYPLPKERMIVGCSDANGSRVLIELEMEISQASRDSGEHYEQAEARAAELGYEEPFFSMDPGEQPHCKLITASRQ